MIEKINGYKTYLGGIGLMLSGAAAMLTGAATIISQMAPLETLAQYLEFFKTVANDPSAAVVVGGFATFSAGLSAIGLKHSHEKLEVGVVTASTDAIMTAQQTTPPIGSTRNP